MVSVWLVFVCLRCVQCPGGIWRLKRPRRMRMMTGKGRETQGDAVADGGDREIPITLCSPVGDMECTTTGYWDPLNMSHEKSGTPLAQWEKRMRGVVIL